MNNKYRRIVMLMVLLVSIVSLYGCSANQAFVLKDAKSIGPLKVVRYEGPPLLIWSRAQHVGSEAMPLLLGIPISYTVEEQSRAFCEIAKMPDYTELVMKGFVKRIGEEIPDWPQMQVENNPVKEDNYKYDGGPLLVFSTSVVKFKPDPGFHCKTTATMTDRNGAVLWKKEFSYNTREIKGYFSMPMFGYDTSLYTADNGKLLKEEMNYAANMAINDFVKHFKEK